MRIFKTTKKNILLTSIVFATLCIPLFAQTIEMPSMPDSPSMPTVQMDGKFYTPDSNYYKPSIPYQNTQKNKSQNSSTETKKTETVITDASNPLDIFSNFGADSSILTASDISSLYDAGSFTDLTSLNGANSLSNYATTSTTNVLLQQVLNSLNEMKVQQNNATDYEKKELQSVQEDSKNFKNREPSILRFRINGYNIADSLVKVFFSDTEPDGTFLLTADRKYFANQIPMTETFYMLFRAVSSTGSTITYKVQPSIVQSVKNENSYVYKLAEIKNLTAEKTGNLVVLHYSEDKFSADMLLDIDRK